MSAATEEPTPPLTPEQALNALVARHEAAVDALRDALQRFQETGVCPDARTRALFRYPELRIEHSGEPAQRVGVRAYGQLTAPGPYALSISQPRALRGYLLEQLSILVADYAPDIRVATSSSEIPYPFVLQPGESMDAERAPAAALARAFPTPQLAQVGDGLVDGEAVVRADGSRPLGLFDAVRTDYSLKRIDHYTGAPWQDVQPWILFTNYQRYVEEFVRYAAEEVAEGRAARLSCPGRVSVEKGQRDGALIALSAPWRNYQMPAYHLVRADGAGVTLVNIGVGPSNAKTITDHLAVLRPHCWLMVGHCGGLRHSQRIGDYVLAHAYLRRDKILDGHVPLEIPIPAIAEVQVALQKAALHVSGEGREALKRRLRTGTVVSYADRNWELNFLQERRLLSQSRAVAVDMESACIATQGFRLRVPYGVLLCVSDKPLHGEIKLPGAADRFYQRAIGEHLQIGLAAIELLTRDVDALHSRKLRSFDEPPFR